MREITTAADLDALPEGDAVVRTSGGVIWIKGDRNMWIKPMRYNEVKIWSSEWLARTAPLALIYDPRQHAEEVGSDG